MMCSVKCQMRLSFPQIMNCYFSASFTKSVTALFSTFFAMTYALGIATLTTVVVHVLLFNGREIYKQGVQAFGGKRKMDIHTRHMKKYKSVSMWWFLIILVVNIALIIYACQHYNELLQLPWWVVLLACAIAIFFTILIGYMYPKCPVANMCLKAYGYINMTQALTFAQDFKFGHYMKNVLQFLVKHACNLHIRDINGNTALWDEHQHITSYSESSTSLLLSLIHTQQTW